ncbi:LytR/AlgR family response regulator transcription factor [Sphingobacterium spiritivorum]|uniref:Response regulator receiver domain protein n=1 Tax=Sphingobacterium spiritivorum ATCC 33861 TaxID=525373 RepID=D7VPF7_SPHSI|nr:LytTR family DNA-binding domain-containing protein [Sphingobacterium spiritivorum]EFK57804.1 response regulator receiver domain protein [Sphingobacterium spiritivorum ATCC 33861]QQT36167.1 response regulator transcription factor [Sphingobacterium spiritivorum]WQD32904.1 LytTR family DNA-binding domain-containing protein [Sphingobacterium spiritivorum]SUJ16311.1 Probable transcriptional regulatory protein YehT [Sphingobacterium spiritivorum]
MNCIIVDDEPIARIGIEKLLKNIENLELTGSFENAYTASLFIRENAVDLIFLDIQMPGLNGLEFAKQVGNTTLIIFTTAFAEFAIDSYEVDAIDYLVKPIQPNRFKKAVTKAISYHKMLVNEEKNLLTDQIEGEFVFIKSDRRYFKVVFKDILFIEGLKDYVIIHTENQKLITHTNLKNAHTLLPSKNFLRVNRSYIINKDRIDSFSNNDVFIGDNEISIGNFYREDFLKEIMKH